MPLIVLLVTITYAMARVNNYSDAKQLKNTHGLSCRTPPKLPKSSLLRKVDPLSGLYLSQSSTFLTFGHSLPSVIKKEWKAATMKSMLVLNKYA